MAEQYLINDTTLTSIADAIRVVTGSYYGRQTIANVWDYWMDVMLPSEMPRAISGIVGITDDVSTFVQRSWSISGSCMTINGMSTLRSYAFAVNYGADDESNPFGNIETVVLNDVRAISDYAFGSWNNLQSMFILGNTVPTLTTSLALSNGNAGEAASIYFYVWSSMYDQFRNDSVWSVFSRRMYSVRNISDLGIRFTTSISGAGHASGMYSEVEHGQYLIQGTTLTSIASAIRGQLGVSTQYLPREMSTAILSVGVPTDSTLRSIIEGTVKSYSDGQKSIGYVGEYAFAYCPDLSSVVLPVCTSISREGFRGDASLIYISCSSVEYIGNMAFYGCSTLKSMSCSKCTEIDAMAFEKCSQLSMVSFPSCTKVSTWTFEGCSSLSSVNMSRVESLPGSNFQSCVALSTASFPNVSAIGRNTFSRCTSLRSLYLMSSSMVSLANSNAFSNTPMLSSSWISGWGSIFVPTSLYNAYYGNTVWSWVRSRLVSM